MAKAVQRPTLSKSAKMIRKGRVLIISGMRLEVQDDPTTVEDPNLGTLYVFRCLAEHGQEHVIRRAPNTKIEVER